MDIHCLTPDLLERARAARLRVYLDAARRLRVLGPESAALVASELMAHKVLLATWLRAGVRLDWSRAALAMHPAPCVDCGQPTRLLDPADGQPRHKTCAEQAVAAALAALAPDRAVVAA